MEGRKIHLFFLFSSLILIANFLLVGKVAVASTREAELRIFQPFSNLKSSFLAWPKEFQGGGSVAIADLGGDGIKEIIVATGTGSGQVRIFRQDGSEIKNFFPYQKDFKGGVEVAAGDLDNDGQAEIVTAPQSGGEPQIRIFNSRGKEKFTPGFLAYHPDFKGGVHLALGDVNGDGYKEIITGAGAGAKSHLRVFDRYGRTLNLDIYPFAESEKGGVAVAAANVDGGWEDEIVVAVNSYGKARVKVYKADEKRTIVGNFLAFPESFTGGVNLAAGDLDNDGYDEILASVNGTGGPQVRGFEAWGGELPINFFAYEEDFKGGVNTVVGDLDNDGLIEIITLPKRRPTEGRTDFYKYIELDLSEQKFRYYENGERLDEYVISSGKAGMATPTGTFKVLSKSQNAYSKKYALWMPWFMGFTSQGHGLHGLPYWKLKGGGVYYEGINHLGIPVSHGCVRLAVENAKKVYAWTDIGTAVVIHK